MKLLIKLEKNRFFWYILALSLIFFLLRIPSLIEPNWYGDEGIYQVIGMGINKGRLLYEQIWDNKPPFLYLVYALFNGDQFQVRFFSLVSGLTAMIIFFYLSLLTFKKIKPSIIASIFFILLFATPILEGNIANAENFMLLPIIASGFLIYSSSQKIRYKVLNTKNLMLVVSGLLLGTAFLFKIVAFFDFFAFLIFLFTISPDSEKMITIRELKRRKNVSGILNAPLLFFRFVKNETLPLILGFALPITLTSLYFIAQGAFSDFAIATFISNVGYVGYGNKFIIPQGYLLLKLILLLSATYVIFRNRKQLTHPIIFISLWFVFSLFNTFFSGRPYTHYALVTIPSFCLLIGLLFLDNKPKTRIILFLIIIFSGSLLVKTFKPSLPTTINYYGNAVSFLSGNKNVEAYQSFFDNKTPRDYEIASYIKTHTNENDNIFVWGDSAQIYALAGKLPPGRYTVSYHMRQYKLALDETQTAINSSKPKYIITLSESPNIPLNMQNYTSKFVFNKASIYERDF